MGSEQDRAWNSQYRTDLGTYQSCAAKLESLIRDLVFGAGMDVVAIESRAKDPDSLERKVEQKRESYEEPLTDVTDLIGVRVIAYYLEDVERINEIVRQEFDVDPENSMDKMDDLEPDRFGYRSVHFVVELSKERAGLAEWAIFGGRKAEIQVRTATQHAWAAVEHKLSYKRNSEAPRKLRRKLMRLSALFELADEQFSVVKDQLEAVEARYTSDVRGGNLDLPIDTSSLEAFLDGNSLVAGIEQKFRSSGFGALSSDGEGYQERYSRDLRDLVAVLEALNIQTIAEFDRVVREASSDDEELVRIADVFKPIISTRSPADLLTLLVGIQKGASIEIFEGMYKEKVVEAIRRLRDESEQGANEAPSS